MYRRLLLAILFILLLPFSVSAGGQERPVRQLTSIEGLSNSSINCILQDDRHLMWFGTWDGLNVYDGETFISFKTDPSDHSSLSNNVIRQIVQWRGGRLWVSTDRGLNLFDPDSGLFTRYFDDHGSVGVVRERSFLVAVDNDGGTVGWVFGEGLSYYDAGAEKFVALEPTEISQAQDMFFDNSGELLVHTSDGRILRMRIDFGSDRPSIILTERIQTAAPVIKAAYDGALNRALVAYADGRTAIVSAGFDKTYYDVPLGGAVFTSASFGLRGCVIGTRRGLYYFDYERRETTPLLEDYPITAVYRDAQDIVWAGTDGQGAILLSKSYSSFETYLSRDIADMENVPVRAFFADGDRNLWVGTKGGGLYRFKSGEHQDNVRKFKEPDGLINNSVYTLADGGPGAIWIGTEGNGLNYFDVRADRLRRVEIPRGVNLTSIYALHPQNDSVLWAGTSGYGVFRLVIDRSTTPYRLAAYTQYIYEKDRADALNNNVVYAIVPDAADSGYLWVGTRGGGLNRMNTVAGTFSHYRWSADDPSSISSDDILSLATDREGFLWIGTGGGLNKLTGFEDGRAVFRRFTEKSGLPNNTIHGILPDDNGNVWISANNGLSQLNAATGRTASYYYRDGLQNNEFADGAYYRSPHDGAFYFGGVSGFNRFFPADIKRSSYIPPLHLSGFYINNAAENLADWMAAERGGEVMRIPGDGRTVSFSFIPMDYIDGAKCDVRYRLRGRGDNWVELGSSRMVVLSDLAPGKYLLEVACSSADKEWGEDSFALPIRVMPPWWAAWWAIAAYIALGVSAAAIAYRITRNRIKMRHSLEMSRFEKEKAEEIHQAKLRFFTNIAHEFSTSLTLIYGPCERMLDMPGIGGARRHLRAIESNAARMQNLIQELMEFRKVETGYQTLHNEEVDIPELVRYTTDNFTDMAEEKKIAFRVAISPEVHMWTTDRQSLEKVLFNLLSNAFKYTPDGGEVNVGVSVEGDRLKLEVRNTGRGIRPEAQEHIFDRFTILERIESQAMRGHETRYGIGLALCSGLVTLMGGEIKLTSVPDEYAMFTVALPQAEPDESPTVGDSQPAAVPARKKADPHPEVGKPAGSDKKRRRETILVIDDNEELLQFIRELLDDEYNVITASGGEEGLRTLDSTLPDLVLCDLIMPCMSGVEVAKTLKNNKLTSHIPIIFLTSDFSVESRIESAETGVDVYITKPFHSRHLKAAIRQQFDRKSRLKEFYDSPLANIDKLDGRQVQKFDREFVVRLASLVDKYMDDSSLSADTLADEMRLSRMQLYRKLRDLLEVTPTEFIRNRRLEHAEKLLKTTDLTVQEIMYMSGFNNKAYFYREFAKLYSKTPKEYRQSFRNE